MKTGAKHSEETKAKISASNKGKPNPNKGKRFSKEWCRNLSESHKGIKPSAKAKATLLYYSTGENNFNWKGGVSSNKAYRDWQKNRWHHRKKNALGSHTFGEWETLKAQYNFTCPCCRRKEPEIKLTIDHVIPLSKGGSDNIENIQPLCKSCNCKKHTKSIRY